MTVTDRLLSVLVLAVLSVGCPSAVEVPEASTGSATSTGSSSSATTSTATPTTSTTENTGVETDTGTTTMAPPSFCDLCGDQQICVEFLDEHTCGQPVDDGTRLVCLETRTGACRRIRARSPARTSAGPCIARRPWSVRRSRAR